MSAAAIQATSTISGRVPHARIVTWGLALLLAIMTTLLNGAIALRFDGIEVFDQYNVLFDADPNVRLSAFANGWGDSYLVHPNLVNFVNPPIHVVAKVAAVIVGLAPDAEAELRRTLALWVAPIASGAKALVLFALLRLLGLSVVAVAAVVVIHAMSFTQLIFGSVPDHDILNGLAIALATFAAVAQVRDRRLRVGAWVGVGVTGIGITITNGVAIGLLLWISLLATGRGIGRANLTAIGLVGVAAALTVAIALPLNKLYGVESRATKNATDSGRFISKYVRADIVRGYLEFPASAIAALAPPAPRTIENKLGVQNRSRYVTQFSLEAQAGEVPRITWLGWALFVAAIIGATRLWREGASGRSAVAGAVSVIGFNWALHGYWGTEFFLYSQAWHVPLLVLLAGLAIGGRVWSGIVALIVLALAVTVTNLSLVESIFSSLTSVHG